MGGAVDPHNVTLKMNNYASGNMGAMGKPLADLWFSGQTRTSRTGFGLNSTPVIIGGGSTANGVATYATLILFLATQLTLLSPSLTRKIKVVTVSQSDIIVVVESAVILESETLFICHSSVGRGLPALRHKSHNSHCLCRILEIPLEYFRRNKRRLIPDTRDGRTDG